MTPPTNQANRALKIFHAADIHLGRRRLDGLLPDSDLAAAFGFIADEAIRERADVFLLAGDLFDRPQVEPPHVRQAQEVLQRLRTAGIPVIAIEGNHDKQFVNADPPPPTWVRFLAEDDLVTLLRPRFNADGVALEPWNATSRTGSWIEIGGVRFVGAGYLGAATPHKLRQILARLEAGRPQVLLLHAGPEYFVGDGGGFSQDDLRLIHEKVTYLALGHIHKPMVHGGWACNPGSPENCDLREATYSRAKDGSVIARGYAVVMLDPRQPGQPLELNVRTNPRRPCLRVELDCTPFGQKTRNGAEALSAAAVSAINDEAPEKSAVVELVLTGALNLNRIALDPVRTALEIAAAAGVHAVAIDTSHLNLGAEPALGDASPAALPRDQLERQAIFQLVGDRSLAGLEDDWQAVADLFYGLKESVRHGWTGEKMASQISTSPLVERIRLARSGQALAAAMPIAAPSPSSSSGSGYGSASGSTPDAGGAGDFPLKQNRE